MKKNLLITTSILVLLVVGFILSSYLVFKLGKPCTCYGIDTETQCIGFNSMCAGLLTDRELLELKLPNRNQDTAPAHISFNGSVLNLGDTFSFTPNDNCVSDVKARVNFIHSNAIDIDILEEQGMNGTYYAVEPKKSVTIKNGSCIIATPLCTDVSYEFCFNVDSSKSPNEYSYTIKSKSTMPLPNFPF